MSAGATAKALTCPTLPCPHRFLLAMAAVNTATRRTPQGLILLLAFRTLRRLIITSRCMMDNITSQIEALDMGSPTVLASPILRPPTGKLREQCVVVIYLQYASLLSLSHQLQSAMNVLRHLPEHSHSHCSVFKQVSNLTSTLQ